MAKIQFLYKIYPPRRGFYLDQNAVEKSILRRHIQYWKDLTDKVSSVVYGPAYDPKGTIPMAVIEVINWEQAEKIAMLDPAILSGNFTYKLFPMLTGVMHPEINFTTVNRSL